MIDRCIIYILINKNIFKLYFYICYYLHKLYNICNSSIHFYVGGEMKRGRIVDDKDSSIYTRSHVRFEDDENQVRVRKP